MESIVIELSLEGTIQLPESIRSDLPPGTSLLVQRDRDRIVLQVLRDKPSIQFDLTDRAFEFANELIAEGYHGYLVQIALSNASQA